MQYKNLTLNIEGSYFEKEFRALIELVPTIPELENLITQATKNGPIVVDFVSLSELDTTGVYQESGKENYVNGSLVSRTVKRSIKVAEEGQSFTKMLDTLIFELCNAKNPSFQMYSTENISPKKYTDREAYALATEFAEYNGTHIPAKAITKAIFSNPNYLADFRKKGIQFSQNDLWNFTNDWFLSFDHWWKHTNQPIKGKNYSHTDVYRRQFDKEMGHRKPLQAKAPVQQQPAKMPVAPAPAPAPDVTKPVTTNPVLPQQTAPVNPMMQELAGKLKSRAGTTFVDPLAQKSAQPAQRVLPTVKKQEPMPANPDKIQKQTSGVKRDLPQRPAQAPAKAPAQAQASKAPAKAQAPKTQGLPVKRPLPASPVKQPQGLPPKPCPHHQHPPVAQRAPQRPCGVDARFGYDEFFGYGEIKILLPDGVNLPNNEHQIQQIINKCLETAAYNRLRGPLTIMFHHVKASASSGIEVEARIKEACCQKHFRCGHGH